MCMCMSLYMREKKVREKRDRQRETEKQRLTEWLVIWCAVLYYFCGIGVSYIFNIKVQMVLYCQSEESSLRCNIVNKALSTVQILESCCVHCLDTRADRQKNKPKENPTIRQYRIGKLASWATVTRKLSASSHKWKSHMGQTMGCCIVPNDNIIYAVSEHHPNPKNCTQLVMI